MPVSGIVPDATNRSKLEPFKVVPGMYFVHVVEVDEYPVVDQEKAEKYGKSWIWRFFVVNEKMKPVLTPDDTQPHPFTQFTSDRMGIAPQTQQPARARMFLQALTREELPSGANAQDLVNKALDMGVARVFLTQDAKRPQYMTIGSMMPVDQETADRVKEALAPYRKESEELPF